MNHLGSEIIPVTFSLLRMSFDIVIFGATGFTGQFVVEELAKVLVAENAPPLSWAVAGRNEGKLKQVRLKSRRRE